MLFNLCFYEFSVCICMRFFAVVLFFILAYSFFFFLLICFLKVKERRHGVGWLGRWEDLGGGEEGKPYQNILHDKTIFNK